MSSAKELGLVKKPLNLLAMLAGLCGLVFVLIFLLSDGCKAKTDVEEGASRIESYLPMLKGKRVGVVVNHTSYVDDSHIVDLLQSNGVNVVRIFAPEHGFRGDHSAGAEITDGVDQKSGVSIFSLYGKHRKPTATVMKELDLCLFDIQDVGCRFYTYISTLFYVLEACAENNVEMVVLDRPNPNGDYVSGPVLKPAYRSFVGIAPIPIVHGCTVGELALMYKGEGWIKHASSLKLQVVTCRHYAHDLKYVPPIAPSPNLPNYRSIRLYPSLCLFEATTVSIGRGTSFPFQVIGYPQKEFGDYSFTPESIPHVSKYPKLEGEVCYGDSFLELEDYPPFTFNYFYQWAMKFDKLSDFVDRPKWLNLLVGDDFVLDALKNKLPFEQWEKKYSSDLVRYKQVRAKYLLYPENSN